MKEKISPCAYFLKLYNGVTFIVRITSIAQFVHKKCTSEFSILIIFSFKNALSMRIVKRYKLLSSYKISCLSAYLMFMKLALHIVALQRARSSNFINTMAANFAICAVKNLKRYLRLI